jgi:hypothetical protein
MENKNVYPLQQRNIDVLLGSLRSQPGVKRRRRD